jgi:hypothetical protein
MQQERRQRETRKSYYHACEKYIVEGIGRHLPARCFLIAPALSCQRYLLRLLSGCATRTVPQPHIANDNLSAPMLC